MTDGALEPTARVAIDPDIITGDVEGEVVALRATADAYLHLNACGSFIFNCLRTGPMTLDALCAAVEGRYDVDTATCAQQTTAFVVRCTDLGLLHIEES